MYQLYPSSNTSWATVVFALMAAGCEHSFATPKTSADYEPREIGLLVDAQSNGWTTQFFVAPTDKYGLIQLGQTDRLFISEVGGQEKPISSQLNGRYVVQVGTKATNFQIIWVRDSKRFVSTVQLPEPFSLRAHWDTTPSSQAQSIVVFWTPGSTSTEMNLMVNAADRDYVVNDREKGLDVLGKTSIARRQLESSQYSSSRYGNWDEPIVRAVRRGGSVTLDPAFANHPANMTLEQIRTVIVTPPPEPSIPPAAIAVDPPS